MGVAGGMWGFDRRALLAALAGLASSPGVSAQTLARGAAPRVRLPLIVLDPGHGGGDPGAIGASGTQEKRITLPLALELKRILEAGGQCRVAMTRTSDVFVPLARRVDLARQREAALLLSIHADASPTGHAASLRGASVYTVSETATDPLAAALARRENLADRAGGMRLPSVSPEVQRILLSLMRQETRAGSERLARLTVNALDGEVGLLNQPLRRAQFVVLKAPDVPAALVECGFLSNPQDEALLRRPEYRAKLARALAEAVTGFIGRRSLAALEGPGISG
ncbi:MAG: cell wall hydrolase [Rubritepida sp.]|nr:cell wall hydrolase [Rubritepida sp.]